MILQNLDIIGQDGIKHIRVTGDKIQTITSAGSLPVPDKNELNIAFENALAFPGLINSHDHLDFNLFPQTGNKVYQNYIEWGADIQVVNKSQINDILKIPEPLRTRWGLYKNLLAGITTVVNHGRKLQVNDELINIFGECQSLHSVNREEYWKFKLNRLFRRKQPVVIHVGEGTNISIQQEIDQLHKWNLFKRDIIGIHGVAMSERQASLFKALVWCPASNDFLFKKTAAIDLLKEKTTILFGTDSTLTASWNIWEHLRLARSKNLMTDTELFESLTINPAKAWNMNDTGMLSENKWADIVIAKQKDITGKWNNFYNLNPEDLLLVLHHGNIRLFDGGLFEQIRKADVSTTEFSKIFINGISKYVQGNVPELMNEIRKYNPGINFPIGCG